MSSNAITDVEAARVSVSAFQRDLLDATFNSWVDSDSWILARALHAQHGKAKVVQALESLGGSIIYEMDDPQASSRYQLTGLGVMLTSIGLEAGMLLTRYLTFVRERFLLDPGVTQFQSDQLRAALGLTQANTKLLGKILIVAPWASNGSNISTDGSWQAGTPRDVDEIPSNVWQYCQKHLLAGYDAKAPVLISGRYAKPIDAVSSKSPLWFVDDPALRLQLESDWKEAIDVKRVGGWKSCVILCGGILEGLLLDQLTADLAKAMAAYSQLYKRSSVNVNSWAFAEMIDVAIHLKILAKGAGHTSHALREYRNLVHPSKQLKDNIVVTELEASLSYNGIQLCIGDFARKREQIPKTP